MIWENMDAKHSPTTTAAAEDFDYAFVDTVGHIAIYDDMRSEPRVIDIQPAETGSYIESLATTVYEQARGAGGSIPYTVIREVSENFIHAQFKEALVTILDHGCTIRFADHGPGIPSKEKAQMPGFSSAVEPMRTYIRGVGSGLPRVREYLELSNGTITIEDNLGTGAVVTISLVRGGTAPSEYGADGFSADDFENGNLEGSGGEEADFDPAASALPYPASSAQGLYAPDPYLPVGAAFNPPAAAAPAQASYATPYSSAAAPYGAYPAQPAPYVPAPPYGSYPATAQPVPYPAYAAAPQPVPYGYAPAAPTAASLTDREKMTLALLRDHGPARQVDLCKATCISASSMNGLVKKLENEGLIVDRNKVKHLTDFGMQIARTL